MKKLRGCWVLLVFGLFVSITTLVPVNLAAQARGGFVFYLPPMFPQTRLVTVCIVQPREGRDPAQDSGFDARELAKDLASRSLSNSQIALRVVLLTGISQNRVNEDTERSGCEYVAWLWRHEDVDAHAPPGIPESASIPSADLSASYFGSIGDQDMILFSLREPGMKKDVAHAAAPPIRRNGKSAEKSIMFTPYPLFSKKIVQAIEKRQPSQ